jgi:hypothetical protein
LTTRSIRTPQGEEAAASTHGRPRHDDRRPKMLCGWKGRCDSVPVTPKLARGRLIMAIKVAGKTPAAASAAAGITA